MCYSLFIPIGNDHSLKLLKIELSYRNSISSNGITKNLLDQCCKWKQSTISNILCCFVAFKILLLNFMAPMMEMVRWNLIVIGPSTNSSGFLFSMPKFHPSKINNKIHFCKQPAQTCESLRHHLAVEKPHPFFDGKCSVDDMTALLLDVINTNTRLHCNHERLGKPLPTSAVNICTCLHETRMQATI